MRAEIRALPALRSVNGGLEQAVRIVFETPEPAAHSRCVLEIVGETGHRTMDLGVPAPGPNLRILFLPEAEAPTVETFLLRYGDETVTVAVQRRPVRRWTVHLVLHSHTDLGFTAPISEVVQIHNRNTDLALEFCRATDSLGEDERFRWTCEVSWQVQKYLQDRTEAQVKALMKYARDRRIEIAALYSGEHTDLLGHEEAVRSLHYAASLRRRYGIPVDTAMLCDVPGCTWGFVKMLAGNGVPNLIVSDNNYGAPFLTLTDLPRPFFWDSPDGSSVLAWYTDHPFYAYAEGELYGFLTGADALFERLIPKLVVLEEEGYPYERFQIQYAFDNAEISFKPAEVAAAWNRLWAWPRIRISTAREFLNLMREERGGDIPRRSGDWTSWWAGIAPGFPVESAISRRLHEALPALEQKASLVFLLQPGYVYPHGTIDRCYDGLLGFDEHSGGGGVWKPRSDEELRQSLLEGYELLYDAKQDSETLGGQILCALAGHLRRDGNGQVLVVLNNLTWDRTGPVTFRGSVGEGVPDVVDRRSGHPVVVEKGEGGTFRFLAGDVPGAGYASYEVRYPAGAGGNSGAPPVPSTGERGGRRNVRIESRHYRATFDGSTGRLSGMEEKASGAPVIATDPPPVICFWRTTPVVHVELGKYIPEHYTGVPAAGEEIPVPEDEAEMNAREDAVDGHCVTVRRLCAGREWMQEEWCLPDHENSVRLTVRISRKIVDEEVLRRALGERIGDDIHIYLRLRFDLDLPEFRYEAPGTVLFPARDQFRGACRDFFAVGHWLLLSDERRNVAVASPDVPLVDPGSPGHWKYKRELDRDLSALYVRAVALNEWGTHRESPFSAAEDLQFRMVFSAYPRGPSGWEDILPAVRLGWESNNPLEAAEVPPRSGGSLADPAGRFFSLTPGNVLLLTMKQAADGDGLIVRLMETAGVPAEATLTFAGFVPASAIRCTMAEEDLTPLRVTGSSVEVLMRASAIETVRIRPAVLS